MSFNPLLKAVSLSIFVSSSSAHATIEINSSAFNAVTTGAINTIETSDWGFVSVSGGFFSSNINGSGLSYNNTAYGSLTNNAGSVRTSVNGASSIGAVTLTEGTSGTDLVAAQNNTSNFTFDGATAFGSYGNFAPGEQDVWQITFNDLGVGQHVITLYLGHSQSNRSFYVDILGETDDTLSGQIGSLGSTVAGIGGNGTSFTYDLDVTVTDANDDLTLTFGDSGGGSFGEAIFAGYTVTSDLTVIPEPSTAVFISLTSFAFLIRRKR